MRDLLNMDSPFLKSINVNETASVIKIRSLDNVVYEQDSHIGISSNPIFIIQKNKILLFIYLFIYSFIHVCHE